MTRLSGTTLDGASRPEERGAGTGLRNPGAGRAQVGQWYARRDKGETFQVIGVDEASRTVEIQAFDGDLDEIDEDTWAALPLALAAQPEDWTGPVDDVERDDLGYSETEMTGADWSEPLQQLRAEREEPGSSRRAIPAEEDEGEPQGEDASVEALVRARPVLPERT